MKRPHDEQAGPSSSDELVGTLVDAASRISLWRTFVQRTGARRMAEIGVYRGRFASSLLSECEGLEHYVMIDPWRRLADWNKPANVRTPDFEAIFREAMERTAEHAARRVVLRGTTAEVAARIEDASLDFAYVDGDHTLRGIVIDLIRIWPKVREGGWIGGDDFTATVWQHDTAFEPTLVFPYAVNFAEAMDVPIHGLPHNQFLIHKRQGQHFRFVDWTASYPEATLRSQVSPPVSRPPGHAARGDDGT